MELCIVFAKAPLEGEVKTRLSETSVLTPARSCELYEAFLRDTLSAAARSRAARVFVNYHPSGAGRLMESIALEHIGPARLVCAPQEGADFTARVTRSFALAEEMGGTANVMIGSDSPCISGRLIDSAFRHLETGNGGVLGPSGEGGLYLIGLRGGVRPDFGAVFGGGAELLDLARWMKDAGVSYSLLEELTDVDVGHDLVTAAALIGAMAGAANTGEFPHRTADALARLKLAVRRNGGSRGKEMSSGD